MVKKAETPADPAAPGAPGVDQVQPGGEHVESLQQIAQLGQQLETPPAAPGAAVAQKAQREAAAAEIAAALSLLRASAVPFAPPHVQDPLGMVWADPQLEKIAAAIVEICVLQGWELDDFFSTYGPYIQLAMALGIPVLATIKLLKVPAPQAPGQQASDGQQQQAQS